MSEETKYQDVFKKSLQGLDSVCAFNKERDIQEVVSGLAVDITDALETGIVKDTAYMEDNNGISEPEQILGRISDPFDAIEASRAIRKYGKKAEPAVVASLEPTSAAAATPAATPAATSAATPAATSVATPGVKSE